MNHKAIFSQMLMVGTESATVLLKRSKRTNLKNLKLKI